MINHTDDEPSEYSDGDEAVIEVTLAAVPPTVTHIFFPVSIYDADNLGLTFAQVHNVPIRVTDNANGNELVRYDLAEITSTETAMVLGELYRREGAWNFRAIGQGYVSGLAGVARDYGVHVG